ncbi:enoyl-CoA hydratase/isomerase family protein [Nocardia cerradoensis]|uniref:Probable enoyl-CoA hydratase EchA17 n=1 Tax=Nocardia cerradoensis TaxID=85688 RepID=A0A231GWD3_9NOCA|nr:enoyl-CoA hydratase-related protein [Nocardia cerradoensis]NKY43808.1 enoyl-CoA hydratase [Nocardia cerradoensis]OXR40929.1 putative enoyl-CoA hydratase [Nocardia cerradoensis]
MPEKTTRATGCLRSETSEGIATITIDRPPANAFDPGLTAELLEVLPPLANDPGVRCIVLRGTGRFFVAGADIAVMRDLTEQTQRAMRPWVDVQRLLETAPKPVLAALNGHALGGGAELALACDMRVMAESATIGFPEISLGLFPGAGGSQRLPRLLGAHRAKLLMMEGTRLAATDAVRIGLVDRVAPDAEFDETIAMTARALADKPTRTIGLLKHVVREGLSLPLEEALDIEFAAVLELIRTADAAEGLQAFLDKRAPEFTGR